MPIADALAVAATVWGLVMAVSPTLQIRRMRQTQSSRDVSLPYLSVLCIGFLTWASYGLSIGNSALVISNTAALSVMVVTIAYAFRLRRRAYG